IPGRPHDGLPQSQRDPCRRDRIVARAEAAAANAAGQDGERPLTRFRGDDPMTRFFTLVVGATILAGLSVAEQTRIPEIAFDSVANPLTLPDDIYLGEIGGVAANSKGEMFVYTRTGHPTVTLGGARAFAHGGSRLFMFDRGGKFLREIGQGSYG